MLIQKGYIIVLNNKHKIACGNSTTTPISNKKV